MKISLFILFKFVFATSFIYAQTNIGGTINIYTPITAIATSSCTNQLAVQNSVGFSVGDRVLIIQMKGATINQTNTASFGNILSINDAGNYEFGTILAINGTAISLVNNLMNSYTISGKVQLIRVPQYTNATVTSTLTALPWNGTIGGVLVLEVSGNLTLQANINTDGDGFRGGNMSNVYFVTGICSAMDHFFISNQALGGFKGEGIAELPATMMTGRGPLANGGGGGNYVNAGGGGGSNASNGGIGGKEWSGCSSLSIGGIGGRSLLYPSKSFLGGGGGGSHQDSNVGTSGGDGGGIIIIKAFSLTSNNFPISSNGNNILTQSGEDGGGGGGGGGLVLLDVSNYVGNLSVITNGGNGGSVNNGFLTGHCHGPGGGGGGGLIGITNTTFPVNVTPSVLGGNPGITTNIQSNCFNTSYGAASGQNGLTQTSIVLNESNLVPIGAVIASNDTTVCNGTCAQLNATGATSYTWSPSIGLSDSTIANPLACPTLTTTYIVTGTDTNNCTSTDTVTITVNPTFQLNQNAFICNGDSAFLGGNFQTTSGVYTDSLQTSLGCDSLIVTTLNVGSTYNDSIAVAICQGDSIFLGGAFQSSAGTFTDSLQTTLGCDSIVTTNLAVNPIFSSTQNSIICQGDSVFFGGNSIGNSGTFVDSLLTIFGCDSVLTLNLTVNPSFQVIQNISICSGDSIFLAGNFQTASGVYTDSLQTTLGCDSLIITNLVVNATFNDSTAVAICQGDSIFLGGNFQQNPGVFIDNLQSVSGCDSVVTTNLSVNPIPTITASNDTTIEACGSVQINATGGISYLWSPSTGLSCTSCPNPVASPIITTTYIVSGTVNGCSNKDTIMVFVEGSSPLIIPNVFSPNFDGMNDGFNIIGGCITSINKKIYNRWGQLLFESNQIVEEWDGRTRAGENVPEGTYFYIFTINLKEDGNETTKIFKGTVTLLR